jgi:hypothetical protein
MDLKIDWNENSGKRKWKLQSKTKTNTDCTIFGKAKKSAKRFWDMNSGK